MKRSLPLAAAAALSLLSALPAPAASLGVPPGLPGPPAGDPAGYLMLVSFDTVSPAVSTALGDVARFQTFYIELADPSLGLDVEIYDPGLYNPSGSGPQLDVNLDPTGAIGTMRYVLYGPQAGDPYAVLADQTFGPDTAGTNRQLVSLYSDPAPEAGLYHLVATIDVTAADTQDISVFGLRVPDHDVHALNLTLGGADAGPAGTPMQGGATIAEPVQVHPFVNGASAGNDAFGPVCGLQFVSYDMEAGLNGEEPPDITLDTRQGFTFPVGEVRPSGDARWFATNLGGVNAGPLDSDDQGTWTWGASGLSIPEDAFEMLAPAIDVNAFSVQVLDYGAGLRDVLNWPDVPDRPPFVVFNADAPRRLYLPRDDGSAPARANLGHHATITGGFPVISQGETSTVEVTVEVRNPHPYALTMLTGRTTVIANPDVTAPVLTGMTGLAVVQAGRQFDFSGDVAAGTTASFTYTLDITPSALGRFFLTGDGSDFVSAGAPTTATYQTPYTDPTGFERPEERLGPICQIEYEAVVPACSSRAEIVASGSTRTCPGTMLTLDGSGSEVFNCDDIGGVPVYQWRANGMVIEAFPGPTSIDVVVLADDTYTLEVSCSTDLDECVDTAEVTFEVLDPPTFDFGGDREICGGSSTSITAMVSTMAPPITDLRWETDPPGEDGDGAMTQTIMVAPSRTTTYTFFATDAEGCEGSGSVTVTVRGPQPTITPPSPDLCPGETIELTAEAGFMSYLWSTTPPGLPGDGAMTPSIMVDATGTYTVTVTDALGCSGPGSVDVVVAPDVTPTITPVDPQLCTGSTVGLFGGAGFVSYAWSTMPPGRAGDGETTPNIVADEIGVTYTLTVIDPRGCSGSTSVTTREQDPFVPAFTPAEASGCPGDTVSVSTSNVYVSYLWDAEPDEAGVDGADTRTIIAGTPGSTYTVTVVDTSGCTGIGTFTFDALPDGLPPALGPSLRARRIDPDDLELTRTDVVADTSGYEIVSLDCDSDLDGTCDVDPTPMALGMPDMSAIENPGTERHVEADGLNRASFLVFYKVRGLSPCSSTPGPFLSP
ncbi:MAG: hypothetical protein AAF533_11655 [Acidobacteriota bacterium]